MRPMLTADEFDSTEAHRIDIVQEVVADGTHLDRAIELATSSHGRPLGVQAPCAAPEPVPTVFKLFDTEDARIAIKSFFTCQPAQFVGR